MMLILSIIVICSYLHSVCLVSAVLKNIKYFKKHLPNGAYAIRKTISRNLNYARCLNIAPLEMTWFMVPVEYIPNGKGIIIPIEYTLMVYSPNGKVMVLWKIVFQSGNGLGKKLKKRYVIKDAMSVKISFMHYMKWARVILPVVFEGFKVVYIFCSFFLFTIIVNRQLVNFSSPPVSTGLRM